jgi:tetratricopeptide (TPR) repeat protein
LAYLKLGRANEAVQAFQKILDLRPVSTFDIAVPAARLQLARAYALRGDKTQARIAYQDFLAQWKDADPDIPLLKQAKAEYAKLQ